MVQQNQLFLRLHLGEEKVHILSQWRGGGLRGRGMWGARGARGGRGRGHKKLCVFLPLEKSLDFILVCAIVVGETS